MSSTVPPIPSPSQKTVLIVEDDPFIAKFYKWNIEKLGARVDVAIGGKKALAYLAQKTPDLVILDLLMPDVSGYDVLEQKLTGKNVPTVIIVTNLSQETDKEKCRKLGVVDFLVKGKTEPAALIDIVKKHLIS